MAFIKFAITLLLLALLSARFSQAHPGIGFGWGGGGGNGQYGGGFYGLFPQFYQFSCPRVDDIVMSVLQKAISKQPRIAASLLRLHFHDCFVQVCHFSLRSTEQQNLILKKKNLHSVIFCALNYI